MTYQGAAAANATSVALPAHQAGDMLVLVANMGGAKPAADATVPNWTSIDSGTATAAIHTAWAVATQSGHTSGVWTGATGVCVIVLRPIDGYRAVFAAGSNTTTVSGNIIFPLSGAPGVGTPNYGTGSFWVIRTASLAVAQNNGAVAPSAHTLRARVTAAGTCFLVMHTQNALATSTGAAQATTTASPVVSNRGQTILIGEVFIPKLTGLI